MPALAGDTQAQAGQQLQAAGLVLGALQTVVDPTCDNIGTVLNQSPAAGGHVSLGTAVSVTLGRAPRLCD